MVGGENKMKRHIRVEVGLLGRLMAPEDCRNNDDDEYGFRYRKKSTRQEKSEEEVVVVEEVKEVEEVGVKCSSWHGPSP